jgi:hypothetical protein
VKRDHGPPAEGAASFHATRWTIVMRAAQSQTQGGQSALAELCRLYWCPLSIFARRRGHSPDDAQDLTQGFSCTCWNTGRLPALTGSKVDSARFYSPLSRTTSRIRLTVPAALKRRRQGIYTAGCRRRRRTLSTRADRVFDSRKNLRCPVGDDGPGKSAETSVRAFRCNHQNIVNPLLLSERRVLD